MPASGRIVHQIVGYDASDRISFQRDIPIGCMSAVKLVAHIPRSDPDALGAYPLSRAQASTIANVLHTSLPKGVTFFLQPCERIEP